MNFQIICRKFELLQIWRWHRHNCTYIFFQFILVYISPFKWNMGSKRSLQSVRIERSWAYYLKVNSKRSLILVINLAWEGKYNRNLGSLPAGQPPVLSTRLFMLSSKYHLSVSRICQGERHQRHLASTDA